MPLPSPPARSSLATHRTRPASPAGFPFREGFLSTRPIPLPAFF